MEINNHKPYSRCRVWWCDVTTSNSIQDGGALVVNILVFDLRVQLQHCTYQRKTLLFALIMVSTFICKREISDLSSPLREEFFSVTFFITNAENLRTFWRRTTPNLFILASCLTYRVNMLFKCTWGLRNTHKYDLY